MSQKKVKMSEEKAKGLDQTMRLEQKMTGRSKKIKGKRNLRQKTKIREGLGLSRLVRLYTTTPIVTGGKILALVCA